MAEIESGGSIIRRRPRDAPVQVNSVNAILSAVAPVAQIGAPSDSLLAWLCATALLPLTLEMLTVLLLRPSARRDALRIRLLGLQGFVFLYWLTRLVAIVWWRPGLIVRGAPAREVRLALIVIVPLLWLATGFGVVRHFRGPCPGCRRSVVIRPLSVRAETRRRTLILRFGWCPRCRGRWVRHSGAMDWTDASDPAYDIGFGVSTTRAEDGATEHAAGAESR